MRGFLSQLRERIRRALVRKRPLRYTATELDLKIAEEERRVADRVFNEFGPKDDDEAPGQP